MVGITPEAIHRAMRTPMAIMMSRAGRAAVTALQIPSIISFQENRWAAPTRAASTAASSSGTWGALPRPAVMESTSAMSARNTRAAAPNPTGTGSRFASFTKFPPSGRPPPA